MEMTRYDIQPMPKAQAFDLNTALGYLMNFAMLSTNMCMVNAPMVMMQTVTRTPSRSTERKAALAKQRREEILSALNADLADEDDAKFHYQELAEKARDLGPGGVKIAEMYESMASDEGRHYRNLSKVKEILKVSAEI